MEKDSSIFNHTRNSGFKVTYRYDDTAEGIDAPEVPVDENTYKYGEKVTVKPNVTAPAGYDFLGWHTVEITLNEDGTVTKE